VHWASIFSALHEIGYDGDVVIESFAKENEAIAKATAIWRKLYDSPEQLAVEGLTFLRQFAQPAMIGSPIT
jgi:D-psicose/D-tagatose/L-ribulose 3-epimerase